jgi:hypothetical protein
MWDGNLADFSDFIFSKSGEENPQKPLLKKI